MEFRYKNNKKDIQTYAEYIFKNSVFNAQSDFMALLSVFILIELISGEPAGT